MPRNAAIPIVLLAALAVYITLQPPCPPMTYWIWGAIAVLAIWAVAASGRAAREARSAHYENQRLLQHLVDQLQAYMTAEPGHRFVPIGIATDPTEPSRLGQLWRWVRRFLKDLWG